MLGVATDLQHTFAKFGKRCRQIGRGRTFANSAFAINRKNLGITNFKIGVQLHLQASLAIELKLGALTSAFNTGKRNSCCAHTGAPS